MEVKAKFSGIKNMLSRDEMKQIKGGSGFCGGGCSGSVGAWTYGGSVSYNSCASDVHTYCRSGAGYCRYC